jgi:hypothetical protein
MGSRFGALGVFFQPMLTTYNMTLCFFRLVDMAFKLPHWTMDVRRCPLKRLVRTVSHRFGPHGFQDTQTNIGHPNNRILLLIEPSVPYFHRP